MSIVAASAPKSVVLFNACEKIAPTNRMFGVGLVPARPAKVQPYTAQDCQWWASQNNDGCTDAEVSDFREMTTMSPGQFHDLAEDVAEAFNIDMRPEPDFDAMAEEAEEAARHEGSYVAPAPVHHILKASDGTALAVLLDDCDPANHAAATSRAHRVLKDHPGLTGVAWIARRGIDLAVMDRDPFAGCLVFDGRTILSARVIESAFGFRLPS